MTNLRFVHAIPGAPSVDIHVNCKKIVTNLSYSEVSSYFTHLTRGCMVNIKVVVSGTNNVVVSKEVSFDCFAEYNSITLSDSTKPTISCHVDNMDANYGYARLNVVHLVPGAPGIDFLVGEDFLLRDVNYINSKSGLLKLGELFFSAKVNLTGTSQTIVGPLIISPGSKSSHTLFVIGEKDIKGVLIRNNAEMDEPLASNFSVEGYMGTWNLIAEIPQLYNRIPCANQVATYTLLNDKIKVYNKCQDKNGDIVDDVTGEAVIVNPEFPAALKVSFPDSPPFGVQSNDPNYLVHMVDNSKDGYAIVGSPNRASYYLLAREKKVKKSVYCKFISYGKKLGYPVDKVKLQYHTIY
jgi:lipocalin